MTSRLSSIFTADWLEYLPSVRALNRASRRKLRSTVKKRGSVRTLSNEISVETCCRLMRFVERIPASEIGFGSKPKNLIYG